MMTCLRIKVWDLELECQDLRLVSCNGTVTLVANDNKQHNLYVSLQLMDCGTHLWFESLFYCKNNMLNIRYVQ